MRAFPTFAAAVSVLILLAACGTKGELVKPPGPPPKTVLDEWFPPAPPAAKPPEDAGKDSKPAKAAGDAKQ
jgi:predicted small lipoprotein YifL